MNEVVTVKKQLMESSKIIVADIRHIIENSRQNAIRSVDFERVQMYWKIGKRIVVEEQKNQERADYGKGLVNNISIELTETHGSGFNKRNLYHSIKLFKTYPKVSALRTQLNWMQYKLLIAIDDATKRDYYETEAVKNNWSGRELERQINSLFYERLLLSVDKEAMMEIANEKRLPNNPDEIIKDPMVLEFLKLKPEVTYRESEIENALIHHLQDFLLELGNGFSFVARQKRITLEDDEFFIDLVFYNRLLKAHVIIEIKTHKLKHEDLGQLQTYVNYYDRVVKIEDENPTIGILLCTKKNETLVKFALPEDNKTIMTSKYQLVLPTEADLLAQISEVEQGLLKDMKK